MSVQTLSPSAVWIRGPKLRQRWDMPASTFYHHLKRGQIPAPEFPFGDYTPHWRMEAVLAHEAAAKGKAK